MKYRDILAERKKYQIKIDDLKNERDLGARDFDINKKIAKNKFKYNFYNSLLKGDSKNENKN